MSDKGAEEMQGAREKRENGVPAPARDSAAAGKTKSGGGVSIWTIFMHADAADMWLMALGFLGAVGDGFSLPVMLLITSQIMNNLGDTSNSSSFAESSLFLHDVNKVIQREGPAAARLPPLIICFPTVYNSVNLLYMALGSWVASFLGTRLLLSLGCCLIYSGEALRLALLLLRGLYFSLSSWGDIAEGYCWTRTGERQASKMRARYLKAVLRQDIEYFDLQLANTAQVVTSVASDSLVIQDVLSEKVPNFIMNATTFFGSYIAAFFLMWRLAVVALPSVVLLIIPGLMYGRILMGLARKMQSEYDKAGSIAEQAISSIRTVYSFVAESRTMVEFSAALEGSVKLGLRQGLAKGIAIGVNGITFAIWAFISWYGSRLVMYHHGRGGTIFAVGASVIVGGLSLGSGLSNVKYFSEASSAGQRIMKVGERGVQMSGGQKQRIAIARAVIKAPKILLLDEATSALDSESERIVQEALDMAAMGRTSIVIAHRLSTIRNVDVIAVVQSGHILESGSHDELIQDPSGAYAALVRLQQNVAKADPDEECSFSTAAAVFSQSSQFSNYVDRSSHSMSRRHSSSAAVSRSSSANSYTEAAGSTPQEGCDGGEGAEREQLPVPSIRRLLLLNAPEWKQATLGLISATLFGAIQPLYAFALGSLIAVYFLKDHDQIRSHIRTYSFIFVALAFFSLVINVCQHYNFAYMGEHLTKRVRERMLAKILTFEVAWFDQDENSTGAICSRLAKDANVVRSLVGDRLALLVQTFSAVTIACTMGLVIAWRLALVMIAVQPIIIVCFYARRVLLKNMSAKGIKAQSESSKLAAEAVSNLRTITAFSSQERILQLFDAAQEGPRREAMRQSWYAGIGLGTSQSLMACTWSLDFWYGGRLIFQGYITAKALFQTFMILVSTGRVIADAGSMTTDLAKGADAVGSVFAVLDRYTRIEPEDSDGHRPERLTGSVDFRDVEFAYPARPDVTIFRGFSLSIEAGRSTALVGQSGCGKSTVISLIERFYDPVRGSVRVDSRDVKSYHLRSLRRHIALVGQEPTLFAGTIRENIIYGTEKAPSEAEVEEAARAANAHDFITVLKDGYDTWCGDRGVQLSGGQKQRIAISRAILKNPAVLLLDEATSALDSQSESVVQEALERVMVGRTSVVVAHRLSTVQNCDVIAVLDKGAVVEKGTHAALLAKGPAGAYYSLVSIQRRPKGGGH
ncbi:hypothetical protein Taro_052262 [Colocasia esculenta]|uniref:Uncharacterized protein n=1 Tax=Colocasia esculenta TaxID=4460 RepID=A0A843XJ45_COLES|nr:hypothetical protein [Colocasia esculenta]